MAIEWPCFLCDARFALGQGRPEAYEAAPAARGAESKAWVFCSSTAMFRLRATSRVRANDRMIRLVQAAEEAPQPAERAASCRRPVPSRPRLRRRCFRCCVALLHRAAGREAASRPLGLLDCRSFATALELVNDAPQPLGQPCGVAPPTM